MAPLAPKQVWPGINGQEEHVDVHGEDKNKKTNENKKASGFLRLNLSRLGSLSPDRVTVSSS